MTAEKAADLIVGNTPLAPEHLPFYRHEPDGTGGAADPAADPAAG